MAADALSLLFRIKADSSQASGEVKNLRELVTKEVAEVKNAATTSAAAIATPAGKVREEINATNSAFAKATRTVVSLGQGIENLASGKALTSLSNLASAQSGVAASSAEMGAKIGLSADAIGLIVLAVTAAAVGLYKLLAAQEEVIIVTKEQITTTQHRVEVARQELAIVEKLNAATDEEKRKREELIAAKRKELETGLQLQKAQEIALVNSLVVAIKNQEKAQQSLIRVEETSRANVVLQAAGDVLHKNIISAKNKALSEAQEKTQKAAEAVDIYSEATGKSKEQLFAHAFAQARHSDSTGKSANLYTDLTHALGLTTNAQGALIPQTDAATLALRRQIGALADVTTEAARAKKALADLASHRDTRIEARIAAIVAIARGNIQTARSMARESLKDPTIGADVKEKRGDEATQKVVEDVFFPPKASGRAAEKARREELRTLEEKLKGIEQAYKSQTAALQREYKLQLISLEEFTRESIAAEEERYKKTKRELDKQRALTKPGSSERAKYDREIEDATRTRADNIQKIQDESAQKQLDSLREHQEKLLSLADDYAQRSAESLHEAADARGITFEEAEQKILEIQTKVFNRRFEILAEEEKRYADNAEMFRRVNDEIKRVTEEQLAFQEEAERRIEAARQKDIDSLLKINDVLYNTELQYEQQARDSHRRQLDDFAEFAQRHLILTRQHRALLIHERAAMAQEEESARYAQEMARLRADEADLKRTAITNAEKLAIEKTYNGLREQENQRHIDEQNRINRQADEETREATTGDEGGGLLGGIKEDLNNIPDLTPAAAAANAVTTAYINMKQAVLDSVDAFIFSSATIGQVLRRGLAETLSSIAKEAAIQGIKQTALALGALASWDLRGFALHGAAAAAWFSIAGGSMLLGRAVMGNSSSAGAALQQSTQPARTTTASTQPSTIEVNRRTTPGAEHLETAAKDFLVAAAQMRAAADRLYSVSSTDIVRAGAPGASREIADAWGFEYENKHPIRNQVVHDGPKGI
ncbi:MAG TPA: hypothetical protein VF791_04180 [Pyrinomonadaceae bacterium]